jgi:hypothetical protein
VPTTTMLAPSAELSRFGEPWRPGELVVAYHCDGSSVDLRKFCGERIMAMSESEKEKERMRIVEVV